MSDSRTWTSAKQFTVAALLARSNMGQPLPSPGSRTAYRALSSAIMGLCEQYMETDAHERAFMSEGRMWLRYIRAGRLSEGNLDIARFYDENYTEPAG